METLIDWIRPELLVLVPVLVCVGAGLKRARRVPDTAIPLLLGLGGALLAGLWVFAATEVATPAQALLAVFTGITQGVLCAGASVYAHQLWKQSGKAGETGALLSQENTDEGE